MLYPVEQQQNTSVVFQGETILYINTIAAEQCKDEDFFCFAFVEFSWTLMPLRGTFSVLLTFNTVGTNKEPTRKCNSILVRSHLR